jgi:hypothetical protein
MIKSASNSSQVGQTKSTLFIYSLQMAPQTTTQEFNLVKSHQSDQELCQESSQ